MDKYTSSHLKMSQQQYKVIHHSDKFRHMTGIALSVGANYGSSAGHRML